MESHDVLRFIAVLSVICIFVCTCLLSVLCICVCTMFIVFVLCLLCLYYVCVLYYVYHLTAGLLDLDAGWLARSQNPEGPVTGHPDTGFLGFPAS